MRQASHAAQLPALGVTCLEASAERSEREEMTGVGPNDAEGK